MRIAIDLGLSFLLCDRNVGARGPEDCGKRFCPDLRLSKDEQTKAWEKVVRKECGERWRLPSIREIQEIQERCIIQDVRRHGISGYVIIGPNTNRVFFPSRFYLLGQGPGVMGFWEGRSLTKIFVPYANSSFETYPNISYPDREGIPIRPVCSGELSSWDKTARFFEYPSDDDIYKTERSHRFFPDMEPEYESSPAEKERKRQQEIRRQEAYRKQAEPKDKHDTGSVLDLRRSELVPRDGRDAFITLQNGRIYRIRKVGNVFCGLRLSNSDFDHSSMVSGGRFEEVLERIEDADFSWATAFFERFRRLPDSNG